MLTILALAALAAPQEAGLDPVPFRPSMQDAERRVLTAPNLTAPNLDGAFLGVALAPDAARVTQVVDNSAASSAGLAAGDVILKVGEREVASSQDVIDAVATHEPGDAVRVVYVRGDEQREADVVLGERPAARGLAPRDAGAMIERLEDLGYLEMRAPDGDQPSRESSGQKAAPAKEPAWLGLSIAAGEDGVAILEVNAGGPAARAGLVAGETITKLGDQAIGDVDGLVEALGARSAGETIAVTVRGDDGERSVRVRLGARPGAAAAPEEAPDVDREAVAETRRAFAEALRAMRERHATEERALRQRFSAQFERLGVNPRRALNAGGLLERRPGQGLLFGEGAGPDGLLRGLRDGAGPLGMEGVLEIEMAPMIEQLLEGRPDAGRFPRALRGRILEGLTPLHPRMGAPGPGGAERSGMQERVEITFGPDGRRIETRRTGRLVDGEWQWTEEVTESAPTAAPPVRGTESAPQQQGRRAETDGGDLERRIDELRRQLDELQRRSEELLEGQDG